MKNKLSVLGIVLSSILLLISIIFILSINTLNIIPINYFLLLTFFLFILDLILILFLIFKFNRKIFKIFKIFSIIISIIFIIICVIGINYLNKTMDLFKNIKIIKEEISYYYVVVLNDSKYEEISDLYESKMGYFFNTSTDVLDSIKLSLEYVELDDSDELLNQLYDKEVEAILISDIIKNKYEEDDLEYSNKTRIIETIKFQEEIPDITKRVSIKNTPFNVLISGMDTYGDISITTRNDVNIIASINPNTNEILLTSIPRDYYVQLHNTTGYKDKLTHASYYGINMAVETIEDLMDIDINYYVKVNFTTVVDLVDEIGGIEVYADQATYTNGCQIYKGYNTLNGKCALTFSRDRHSYIDGDRHRGRNQQQVIIGIFNKLTSGTVFLTKYTDILSTLDGKFATNMETNEITDFLKYELNDLKDYTIKTIQVDGYGSMGPTYSYPNQDLWIMIPYEETVNDAKVMINKLLNNESIK